MNFEDSRNAIYCDPNAFIQKAQHKEESKRKKIVFQQPYESMPAFYIDNNFQKRNCDCVPQLKPGPKEHHGQDCFCNHEKQNSFCNPIWKDPDVRCDEEWQSGKHYNQNNWENHLDNCNHNKNQHDCAGGCHHYDKSNHGNAIANRFGFDFKSLLPLLGIFGNNGAGDLGKIMGLLNSQNGEKKAGEMNPISSLLSNKDAISGILNLFKGGGLNLFNKKQTAQKEIKTTDFEIKNYTRVE